MVSKIGKLRALLKQDGIIVAPGAYDGLTSKLIEAAGFSAVYVTGAGIAVSKLGVPDIGLTTMNDVLETARNIVQATDLPVICDADTGYGNPLNVVRTVREFERIGVEAIQIEDQVMPKKCGHIEGKQIIPEQEMLQKIRAFRYARESEDFLLIARTDAIAVNGFEDAVERARHYADAGADILFIEAPHSIKEMAKLPELIPDTPLLVNMVEGGSKTPILPIDDLQKMGFKIVIFPVSALLSAIKSIQLVLAEMKKGSTSTFTDHMIEFHELFDVVGLPFYRDLESKFLTM